MNSTLQELSMDTNNTNIGVRTKKLCKFQNLKKISKHCSTFSRRGYGMLMFSDIILAPIESRYIRMDSKLQDLSKGTKNTHIGVRMTKLWSYEVGAKAGKLQQRRAVRTSRRSNVATLQRAAETQHPDVATLPNGIKKRWIFSPF